MHWTNLKGVNFSSSVSKARKPCVTGSPVYCTQSLGLRKFLNHCSWNSNRWALDLDFMCRMPTGVLPVQCPVGREGRKGQTVGPSQAVHAAVQTKHGGQALVRSTRLECCRTCWQPPLVRNHLPFKTMFTTLSMLKKKKKKCTTGAYFSFQE